MDAQKKLTKSEAEVLVFKFTQTLIALRSELKGITAELKANIKETTEEIEAIVAAEAENR